MKKTFKILLCVSNYHEERFLTIGKIYESLNNTHRYATVKTDNGVTRQVWGGCFYSFPTVEKALEYKAYCELNKISLKREKP